jgi:hypothetical protein
LDAVVDARARAIVTASSRAPRKRRGRRGDARVARARCALDAIALKQ